MQRYGPPPSYPNLKIPGLNAPIPPGCSFGYHAGGWGKPPVDERGRPLYGDVFGVDAEDKFEAEKPSENLWGEMESESDSSDDDSEEEVSEEEGDQDGTGVPTAADPATIDNGLVTPSGQYFIVYKTIRTVYPLAEKVCPRGTNRRRQR